MCNRLYFLLCYLGSFILVLHFTIRFMIHFELIFVNNVKSVSRLIFCIQTPSCLSTVCLLKRLSLLQCIAFATLSKIISLYLWGSISGLSILFCWLLSILSPIPQCLDYHSFKVSLELGSVCPLTLFFFNTDLAILVVWSLHIYFRISMPIFTTCWHLTGAVLNL